MTSGSEAQAASSQGLPRHRSSQPPTCPRVTSRVIHAPGPLWGRCCSVGPVRETPPRCCNRIRQVGAGLGGRPTPAYPSAPRVVTALPQGARGFPLPDTLKHSPLETRQRRVCVHTANSLPSGVSCRSARGPWGAPSPRRPRRMSTAGSRGSQTPSPVSPTPRPHGHVSRRMFSSQGFSPRLTAIRG